MSLLWHSGTHHDLVMHMHASQDVNRTACIAAHCFAFVLFSHCTDYRLLPTYSHTTPDPLPVIGFDLPRLPPKAAWWWLCLVNPLADKGQDETCATHVLVDLLQIAIFSSGTRLPGSSSSGRFCTEWYVLLMRRPEPNIPANFEDQDVFRWVLWLNPNL